MTVRTETPDRAITRPQADEGEWQRWREARWQQAQDPHGVASLTATVWLGDEPTVIDGLDGSWRVDGGRVSSSGGITLAVGESTEVAGKVLRAIARDGRLALRVFDPQAPTRTELTGIDVFPWQESWRAVGDFEPDAEQVRVDQVDGGSAEFAVAGRVRFSLAGREHTLVGFRSETGLHISFGDLSNGSETKQFRFLDVPLSAPHDTAQPVVVDFNRAYLPPCSFAPAYLCPLPPAGNRLDLPVLAGEQRQRYAAG